LIKEKGPVDHRAPPRLVELSFLHLPRNFHLSVRALGRNDLSLNGPQAGRRCDERSEAIAANARAVNASCLGQIVTRKKHCGEWRLIYL
jgi:hypothetical protein